MITESPVQQGIVMLSVAAGPADQQPSRTEFAAGAESTQSDSGTRSDHGLETLSIMHTLFETARRQVKKAKGFLVDLFTKETAEAQPALHHEPLPASKARALPLDLIRQRGEAVGEPVILLPVHKVSPKDSHPPIYTNQHESTRLRKLDLIQRIRR
jgi:hypothetical protein